MTKDSDINIHSHDGVDDPSVLDHRAMVKEQAATWLIRIGENNLLPDEVTSLRQWVGRSDFHREYFIQLSQNWDDMAVLQELAILFAVPRADTALNSKQAVQHSAWSFFTGKFNFPRFAIAASAVLCTFALMLMGRPAVDVQQMTLHTAVGEQRVAKLDDGSVLTMNTDSEITVDYSGDNRIVRLERGEVNFDVSKDPHRPFIVYAGDGLVWAVGTAFNVRVEDGNVDLTVTEGRVKVYTGISPSAPLPILSASIERGHSDSGVNNTNNDLLSAQNNEAFVKAGEVLQYSQVIAQREKILADQVLNKLAWQHGALIFKGETLEQAVVEISRYTDKQLQIIDPSIKSKKVGGHYKTDDIDGLLRTMGQSFGIHIAYLDSGVIHLSSK